MIDASDLFTAGRPVRGSSWARRLRRHAGEATLASARGTQALVIATVDVLTGGRRRRSVAATVLTVPRALARTLVDDPDEAVNDAYALAVELLVLHRNFVHRLLEALDVAEEPPSATVVPLRRRGA